MYNYFIKIIFVEVRKYIHLLLLVFLCIFTSKTLISFTPIIFGNLVDSLNINSDTKSFFSQSVNLGLIFCSIWFLSKLFIILQDLCFSIIYRKTLKKIMQYTLMHVHSLPCSFYTKNNSGNIIQKIRLGTRGFDMIFSSVIFTFVPTIIEFVLILSIFFYYLDNIWYLLSLTTTLFAYYYITLYLTKARLKEVRDLNTKEISLFTYFSDNLTNFEAIKIFNKNQYLEEVYQKQLTETQESSIKITKQMCKLKLIQDLILYIILTIFIFITILQYQNNLITAGQLVMFVNYLLLLFSPIETLALEQDNIQTALVDTEELISLIKELPEKDESSYEPRTQENIDISVKNLMFSYDKTNLILNNLSFEIKANSVTAIVGKSGSGKTTLVKLILRLYDFDDGDIFFNGENIKLFALSALRNCVSYISQDVVLFNDTIWNNIIYSINGFIDVEEVYRATKLAQIHDVITKMPDGYNTIVGERGAQLSGGERQRISIARALLKNSKVLIFDEITSSLDVENKRKIEETITSLKKDYTIIVILHNPENISKFDKIILLDQGTILAEGNHYDLLNNCELYSKLGFKD